MSRKLGEVGGREDVRRAEARADPVENRAGIVVLKGPLEAVRIQ